MYPSTSHSLALLKLLILARVSENGLFLDLPIHGKDWGTTGRFAALRRMKSNRMKTIDVIRRGRWAKASARFARASSIFVAYRIDLDNALSRDEVRMFSRRLCLFFKGLHHDAPPHDFGRKPRPPSHSIGFCETEGSRLHKPPPMFYANG